ncbi:MAG: FAD-dependent oxidoreductase [Propionibacteriaceae bacterium]|nr:FAD-dependent oxidoreductase [Propionibacteriaceae bacterium]
MATRELSCDVAVIGGGLGGCAAALALARSGLRVVMSEETSWIGGQLTSQMVPLDEHRRIEYTGANATYRELRAGIRSYYRQHYPLTPRALEYDLLNPGAAWVSPISAEPKVCLAVLQAMLAPYQATGDLSVLTDCHPCDVITDADSVRAVTLRTADGDELLVTARFFLDATELGQLLALGGVEQVSGRESQHDTGEPSAAESADPTDMQSATWCFAIDYRPGEDHTIERPADYDRMRDWRPPSWQGTPVLGFFGPGEVNWPRRHYRFTPNLGDDPYRIDTDHRHIPDDPELWNYRRVLARELFLPGAFDSDVVVVNWPMNDYTGGALFGVPDAEYHRQQTKELARCLLYWLQTDAPRPDGAQGWPGLRLRADQSGTSDGFAMAPYIRESRRIKARYTIVEQDVSADCRERAATYHDSVGVGHYYWMDIHATTGGRPGRSAHPLPFQIPLRALLPIRVRNLLPAAKNIGTTQITNGCYRLHPVEWSIGEAAGQLAAFCLAADTEPHAVSDSPELTADFQRRLRKTGVQLHWPDDCLTW